MCFNTSTSRSLALFLVLAACKSGASKNEPTTGSAVGSAGSAGSAVAVVAPDAAAKPATDVTPRAKQLADAQITALHGLDQAALSGTFSKDAVILASGAGHETSDDMLAQTFAQLSPHDTLKDVSASGLVAGGNDDAVWWFENVTIEKHNAEPGEKPSDVTTSMRVTELATAASGWKVVAAAAGASGSARQPGGVFPIPDATSPGPLAALLADPAQLAAALAPDAVAVGYDDKVGAGADKARAVVTAWPKGMTVTDAREVRDAKSGFVQANVSWPAPSGKPYRATAQVLALPKADGSWSVVAVQLLAL